MGVGAGLYTYDVVVEKLTFAISSDEFLYIYGGGNERDVTLLAIDCRKQVRLPKPSAARQTRSPSECPSRPTPVDAVQLMQIMSSWQQRTHSHTPETRKPSVEVAPTTLAQRS